MKRILAVMLLVLMTITLVGSQSIITFAESNEAEVYSKGDKGDAVKEIQERLAELGYEVGKPDGSFGNNTKKALENFQKNNGLDVTGVADEETQKTLFSSGAKGMPIVRKKGKTFSIGSQDLTVKSTSFTTVDNRWRYVKYTAGSGETYLIVKATLKYNGSGYLSAGSSLNIDARYEGRRYTGVRSPANNDQYYPYMWAAGGNAYLSSGKNINMIYSITLPKEASKKGSLSLVFSDGTELVIRN